MLWKNRRGVKYSIKFTEENRVLSSPTKTSLLKKIRSLRKLIKSKKNPTERVKSPRRRKPTRTVVERKTPIRRASTARSMRIPRSRISIQSIHVLVLDHARTASLST